MMAQGTGRAWTRGVGPGVNWRVRLLLGPGVNWRVRLLLGPGVNWRVRLLLGLGLAWAWAFGCPDRADAQDTTCAAGKVAWVSSLVDANVGLASGSGRCSTATVAGAGYNDPAFPWGIQAAFDCACQGLQIRILGNTGDYGSATNSWNNRFDSNKDIRTQVSGVEQTPITVTGWGNTATSCEDSSEIPGCPVLMDFSGAGAVAPGFTIAHGDYEWRGIRVYGAPGVCWNHTAGVRIQFAGIEAVDCGSWGIQSNATNNDSTIARAYVRGSGGAVAGTGGINILGSGSQRTRVMFSTVQQVLGIGIRNASDGGMVLHNIVQLATGDCVQVGERQQVVAWNTLRQCGGDGIDTIVSPGNFVRTARVMFNLIVGSGGWGINALSQSSGGGRRPTSSLSYNVLGANVLGDINPAGIGYVLHRIGNIEGATVTFAGAFDNNPTSGAELAPILMPRGVMTLKLTAGANPDADASPGGGGGGGSGPYTPAGFR